MITPSNVIALISIIFALIIVGLYFRQFSVSLSSEQTDWAGFGSYIGGTLGAMFAFASFWILFFTFGSQQKQVENSELQKFETTFYSLLALHNQSLKELESKIDKVKLDKIFDSKQEPEEKAKWRLQEQVLNSNGSETYANEIIMSRLNTTQEVILEELEISQYFRILYQLLKFVAKYNVSNIENEFDDEYLNNKSTLSVKYEKMYASLIRAFVPVNLLPILAINCIPTDNGLHNLSKYRKLLDRYEFLEHIQLEYLPDNPTTFLIFQGYSKALGENRDIKNKIESIRGKHPFLFSYKSTQHGYLSE